MGICGKGGLKVKNVLAECTKTASYLLWENTRHDCALDLWYCSENIAFYFESNDIISIAALKEILKKSKYDFTYVEFVRKISFLIYLSTHNADSVFNWYVSERLLNDSEWCNAIVKMAFLFRSMREGKMETTVRSGWIKRILAHEKKLLRG